MVCFTIQVNTFYSPYDNKILWNVTLFYLALQKAIQHGNILTQNSKAFAHIWRQINLI